MKEVSSFKFQVSGFRFLAAGLGVVLAFTSCSKEGAVPNDGGTVTNGTVQAGTKAELAEADLLMRVRFAGTAALMANTNAAYLTNIAALPETAALGRRIVEKMAGLPERLVKRGVRNAERGTNNPAAKALEPVLTDLLGDGFALELRGDSNGVTRVALGAKADAETATRWNKALAEAAKAWFDEEAKTNGTLWTAGSGKMQVVTGNGGVVFGISEDGNLQPGTFNLEPVERPTGSNILEVQLASSLLPEPIRRSVYGGFERLELSVTPENQSLKIRGKASYRHNLPELGKAPVVPADLVREPAISFSMVRHPGAWLASGNALLGLLPTPTPDVAYFWGGESSPQQWFMAVPFAGTNLFDGQYAPTLLRKLEQVAMAIDYGPVVMDQEQQKIQWQGLPFFGPQVMVKEAGGEHFVVAEVFPAPDFPPGLSPVLLSSVSGRTNLVLFDWEFVLARLQTWFRLGQLGIILSGHNQLAAETAAAKWMDAAPKTLLDGGNTTTEITQTGPRELSVARRAPLSFTSLELFWLANWLESTNFPAANFLMPAPKIDWGPGPW